MAPAQLIPLTADIMDMGRRRLLVQEMAAATALDRTLLPARPMIMEREMAAAVALGRTPLLARPMTTVPERGVGEDTPRQGSEIPAEEGYQRHHQQAQEHQHSDHDGNQGAQAKRL